MENGTLVFALVAIMAMVAAFGSQNQPIAQITSDPVVVEMSLAHNEFY